MTNVSILSGCIIFINTDLTQNIIQTLTNQLYLSTNITASQFDYNVAHVSNYISNIHLNKQRILVLRNLQDLTNRNLADIVLFAKNGLVTVEYNKYGPHQITLPIASVLLPQLFKVYPAIPTGCPCDTPDLDDGFVGETDDDNFDAIVESPNTDPAYPGTGKSSF